MNSLKQGVISYGIRPEMVQCDAIIQHIFNRQGQDCVRTSIVGKQHKKGSLHPPGFATDYRTRQIPSLRGKEAIVDEIKKALPCCDVILEHVGGEQEHIHCEFDPKDDKVFQRHKTIYKRTGRWPE